MDKDHYDYTVNATTGEVTGKEQSVPVPPHEKEETTVPAQVAPVLPHEKAEAEKPAPAGPKADKAADSKVTITLEEQSN